MRTPRSHSGTDTCGVSPPAKFCRCASPCEPLWPPVFVTAAGPRRRAKVGTDAEGVCPPAKFCRCASPCEPLWPPVFVTAAGPRRRAKVGTDAEGVCPRCWSAASAYRICERRGPTPGQTPAASVTLLTSAAAHLLGNRCGRRCLSPLLVRGAERRWGLTPQVSVPGVGPRPRRTENANAAVPQRDRPLRRQSPC